MPKLPGLPSIPGPGDVLALVQQQTQLLRTLPDMFSRLQKSIDGLATTLEKTASTMDRVDRVAAVAEEQLGALQPLLARLTARLDGLDLSAVETQAKSLLDELTGHIARMDTNLAKITTRLDDATEALERLPGVRGVVARRRRAAAEDTS